MPTVTQVNDLKINKLTKAQYDAAVQAGTIGENEISIITDLDATPQVDVMPAASAANKDHIIQYIGETTADYQNGYFYKSMSGGACTVTEYISLYEDQPSVMPTLTFERDVFDKYLEDNELAPNTGSSIRAELYTDEEEGDTYYKIIYNINNTDDEFILDIENNYIEDVVEVNKGFKKVGIISTFCESDMDVWDTQLFESITMTLPNTSSYFWLQIDTQPIKDTLPPRMNNFTENSFLVTDYDNNLMWNNCQDKILPCIDNNCRLLTSMGNRPKWSDICIKSNIQDRTICLSNDQNLADERIYTGFHNSIVIGARTVNGGGQPTNANNLVAVGQDAFAYDNAVAVGYNAGATTNAIQLGTTGSSSVKTVNNDQNTFKVANANGNFEMMSSDGTIPEARLADTTNAQQGDVLTLDSKGNAVWQAGGSGLPDQTGNAGKYLTTDGTDASWGDALTNKATSTQPNSYLIGNLLEPQSNGSYMISIGDRSNVQNCSVAIGGATRSHTQGVAIGYGAQSTQGVSIGYDATCSGSNSVVIGHWQTGANFTQSHSVVLGSLPSFSSPTSEPYNTKGFYWAEGEWDSTTSKTKIYKLFNQDGSLVTKRLADTTNATQGQVLTLDANGNAEWATPSIPTLNWYTISTAGTTLTIADTSSAQLVKIYKNGLLLQPTEDYTISGTTLTTVSAMVVGDKITTEVF